MSIQNKPDYKVFASDAKSGEIETFPDILRGWGVTIDRTGEIPPMEWFNAIGKRVDEWLLYLTQRGVPEWDSSLDYPKTAIVTHGDVIYISLKATKGEQPDTTQATWSTLSAFLGLGNYATKAEVNGKLSKDQNGADIPNVAAFRSALQLGTAALASMGVGKNQVLSASDFSSLVSGNGYLYIPSIGSEGNPVKIMLQWGIIQTRSGENNSYNLPYAFPTGGLLAVGSRGTSGYNAAMNVRLINRSQIDIQNWSPAGSLEDCCFFAVGYL